MPTLDQWPDIIALAASNCLSVPEAGYTFEVFPWATGKLDTLPCGLVQLGGVAGPLVIADGEFDTVCQCTANMTLWLFLGDHPSASASALMGQLAARLLSTGLASAAADPLNDSGHVPRVSQIDSPGLIEIEPDERQPRADAGP
jgi:hypothetical protein